MKPVRVEISYKTIIFTFLFSLALYLLWLTRDIILLFFICFIFMEAINPTVKKLERFKIPRPLAILLLYIVILSVVSFAVAGIVPILVEQTTGLVSTLPKVIANIKIFGASAADIYSQFKILESLPQSIAQAAFSIVNDIFSGFIVLVITFYLLLERRHFHQYSFNFFGHNKNKALKIIETLETRLGSWLNAELFLMTTIGLLSYIGFLILGLPYALPLAIIAGLLEAIPNIGPTISAFLAGLIGLTISPLTALLAVVWGIIVQQLENNIIVPKIMKETIGLNPLVTILVIATGAKLAGVGGALLAVPIYLTIETIIKVITDKKD
jgi:predicted PurR-regulated permease PerM